MFKNIIQNNFWHQRDNLYYMKQMLMNTFQPGCTTNLLYVISYAAINYCGCTHQPTAEVQNKRLGIGHSRWNQNILQYYKLHVTCGFFSGNVVWIKNVQ